MYFDTNESKTHMKAKEKLFDLIICKRIIVCDQYGNQYDIFTGRYDDEFLHLESFVMDYNSDVLFSSKETPCKKYMDELNKKPKCDMRGYFGAFKELPCQLCISNNFRKFVNGSSQFASYRPDISFGYNGIHKIWLEIKNESPCSKNKIEFCKEKGIILLEIDAKKVMNFNEYIGNLIFDKLEIYNHVQSVYDDIEIAMSNINEKMKNTRFIVYKEILDSLIELQNFNDLKARNIFLFKKKLEEKYTVFTVDNKITKNHFGIKKKSTIVITNEDYEIIKNKLIEHSENINKEVPVLKSKKPVMRICHKCKEKSLKEDMVKVEGENCGKSIVKYFHNECL